MIKFTENSLFIADSHYNQKNKQLISLLKSILNESIPCTQLFLMGDIFDFLAGEIIYFQNINHNAIDLINEISYHKQVIYFEGNHDYNLKKLFPNSIVIPRDQQPVSLEYNNQVIKLSHGDIFTPTGYNLYCSVIRSHSFLKFLNFIDWNYWLTYKVEKALLEKKICSVQDNFDSIIDQRIKDYDSPDLIIEGHYHQAVKRKNYINLPSLCCTNQYMIYKNNQFSFHSV